MNRQFPRDINQLDAITNMTADVFSQHDINPALRHVVDLAIEELFVNMVKYNTESDADIELEISPSKGGVQVSLTDYDVERFDPTAAGEVDVDAPLAARTPGGLGLYLVLKMVDSIHYQYRDRQSKITFIVENK